MRRPPTLRPAAPEDLPEVVGVERRAHRHPWSEELLARELHTEWSTVLVAEAGGRVVGFAVAWTVAGEVSLLDVAVDPSARRQGVARALLDELIRRGREAGADTFTLEVRRSNAAARALYEGLGFNPTGVRPGYYASDREDAILMERAL